MPRDVRTHLADIAQCIEEVETFVAGKTLDEYEENILVQRAVEREFTIIAEALSRISRMSAELSSRIDDVRQIAGFRNIIVHDYHVVDPAYVWKVVQGSLPTLKHQVNAWMVELDS